MSISRYISALEEATKALRFYGNPQKWRHEDCVDEGCILEYGEAPAQDALAKIAHLIAPAPEDGFSLAPWTEDQIESLNRYQSSGNFHPFTYGEGSEKVDLIATPDGWVEYEGGPVVQVWAHSWMADWSWRNPPKQP